MAAHGGDCRGGSGVEFGNGGGGEVWEAACLLYTSDAAEKRIV